MINELIQQLQEKAGLSTEQANTALQTIKQYVVEKFPMLAGAVDNIFPSAGAATTTPITPTTPVTPGTATTPTTTAAPQQEGSFLDKISDYIPGQAGQSIEDFAKKAAHGAGDLFNKK
jgi:hypothetical protein